MVVERDALGNVGFRLGASPHERVVARQLFPVQSIICASPAHLQENGAPDSLATFQPHRCSVFRNPGAGKIVSWRIIDLAVKRLVDNAEYVLSMKELRAASRRVAKLS